MISRIIAFSPIVHGDSRVSQEEQRIQKTDLISYRYFYTRLYKYIYMYVYMYVYIYMYVYSNYIDSTIIQNSSNQGFVGDT